jgi:microcystin-dependent protein
MSEPFVGEIKMFAGNFAPRGYAFCDGQLLAVSQNDALFSLYGTIYGGDGRTTFGLPDLRGRIPLHQGQGPGLSDRRLGSKGGTEKETLTLNQTPGHTHTAQASNNPATSATLNGNVLAKGVDTSDKFYVGPVTGQQRPMVAGMVANTGGSRSHSNLMPTLCIHFIVALVGIYPSRH